MLPRQVSKASAVTLSPMYALGLEWLLRRLEKSGVSRLQFKLPGNKHVLIGAAEHKAPVPSVEIIDAGKIFKAARGGLLGWAEGYIKGFWQTPDLRELVAWAIHNERPLEKAFKSHWLVSAINRLIHWRNHNSRKGSRRNIAAHYDLGNDFYKHWLDSSMTYSSALFSSEHESLEQAQQNKYQKVKEWLEFQPGQSVLEIGCGWGGFARSLAAGKPAYTGITLSAEQLAFASAQNALAEHLEFELTDYRDINRQFDRIVSIEMLEAVGEKHWPVYFDQLFNSLKPGGVAVIQVITIAQERFERYRKNVDFIQRYIFPGGMLPSHETMQANISQAGLVLDETMAFGDSYARTLRHWYKNFNQSWPAIRALGFDDAFQRMWNYYLVYCEAGFHHQSINVRLYQCRKPL